MAQRPLVERLPLGVRSVRTASVAAVAPPPVAVAPQEPDLAALLTEARRLSDTLQPNAIEAWAAAARAAEGVELDARDRAEIADHQAMGLGPEGIALFERAAELYAEAGDPGEALAARTRAAYVHALTGHVDEALAAVAGPYDEILALYAGGGTDVHQTASVLMGRARVLMRQVQRAGSLEEPAGIDDGPVENPGASDAPLGDTVAAAGGAGEDSFTDSFTDSGTADAPNEDSFADSVTADGPAEHPAGTVGPGADPGGTPDHPRVDADGTTGDRVPGPRGATRGPRRATADEATGNRAEGSRTEVGGPSDGPADGDRAEGSTEAGGPSDGPAEAAATALSGVRLADGPEGAMNPADRSPDGVCPADGFSDGVSQSDRSQDGVSPAGGSHGHVGPATAHSPADVRPDGGSSFGSVLAAAEVAAREVLALVKGRTGDDVRLAARAAEAQAMLAELAAQTGEVQTAAELFARAAEGFVGAGLPWFAVEYEAKLAGLAHHLGDLAETERALRAALEHGGPHLEPTGRAQLHLQLAEVVGGRGLSGEAAGHALEAAHWADEAGEGPTLGAWARHQLGGFLLRQGRWAEAAEVLESALTDLSAETHGDGAIVQTQWWLGDCLNELGEHREAAERRLQAAEIARHWPEQHDHATLAHLAAESLGHAGLPAEADQAYTRAGELWRTLGNVHGLVRSLRARAWLALGTEDQPDAARELMADAVRECETALAAAADDEETRRRLVAELGHTHRQFGDLLARSAAEDAEDDSIRSVLEEALSRVAEAIVVFTALGADALPSRTGAELAAGWLEADLSRPSDAAARARAVLSAYTDDDEDEDETARARRAEARQLLGVVEEQAAG
ncbi:tetratricopeptide repeat protein [Streptomyces sp. NPDC003011]